MIKKDEYLLSFELNSDEDSIEIHANENGIDFLMTVFQNLLKMKNAHEHLMTENYGGSELSEELCGLQNNKVNKVKIFKWETRE